MVYACENVTSVCEVLNYDPFYW